MSNLIFPSLVGLTWPVVRQPMWKSRVDETASGREFRQRFMQYPRWLYRLKFAYLRDLAAQQDYQTLAGFFNRVGGDFDTFLFDDINDNTATNQSFGVGDGTTVSFQLARIFGGFAEPVYDLNGTPLIYKSDGLGVPTRVSSAPRTNYLSWSQDMSNAAWTKRGACTATANAAIAPDGTNTMCRIDGVGDSGVNDIFQSVAALTPGQPLHPSFYIKKITATGTLTVQTTGFYSRGLWYVDLSKIGAGTERITADHPAVTIVNDFYAAGFSTDGMFFTTGTPGVSLSFYLWGAQLEPVNMTYGPELVTNGTFDAGLSSWTKEATATASVSGGQASATSGPATNLLLSQVLPTVAGKRYTATAKFISGVAVGLYFGSGAGATDMGGLGSVQSIDCYTTFKPTGVGTLGVMTGGAAQSVTFDNVSVREVLTIDSASAYIPTTTGRVTVPADYSISSVLGTSELLATFASGGWTLTGSSVSGGALSTPINTRASQTLATVPGRKYTLKVTISTASTRNVIQVGSTGAGSFDLINAGYLTTSGQFAYDFVATATQTTVTLINDVGSSGTSAWSAASVVAWDFASGLVTFNAAPPAGAVLTWTGSYYWRCRFTTPQLEMSKFMSTFWEAQKVEFKTVKP